MTDTPLLPAPAPADEPSDGSPGAVDAPRAATPVGADAPDPNAPLLGFDVRAARIAWSVALVAGLLYLVFAMRQSLFIFVLGVFFAYLVFPLVARISALKRPRMSRAVATAIVFGGLIALIAGISLGVGPTLADQASSLSTQLPQLMSGDKLLARIPLPGFLEPYRAQAARFVNDNLKSSASFALPMAREVGTKALVVASNLIYVVIVPILAFLLIKDGAEIRDRFLAFTARGRHPAMWRAIVRDLDDLLGSYMRALLLLSLATLVVYSIAFSIAGVPFGLLLALMAAVLEFVPVLGPLAAAAATVIVAMLTGYEHVLLLLVIIGAYRLFQDYVLNPYLMSGGADVSPLLVLFGLLAGEEVAGIAGIFLSVPVLAAVRILATRISAELRTERGEITSPG